MGMAAQRHTHHELLRVSRMSHNDTYWCVKGKVVGFQIPQAVSGRQHLDHGRHLADFEAILACVHQVLMSAHVPKGLVAEDSHDIR